MAKGKRDCAGRYEAIASYLRERNDLPNDLRILDFGALDGYFSQRLAEDFGGHVVAIEENRKSLAHLAGHKQIRTRIAHYSPDQIRNLGHFDVVLGLSVLHHQSNWREYLEAFLAVGDLIFVEVSNPEEKLPRAVAHKDATEIAAAVAGLTDVDVLTYTPGYDEGHERPLFVIESRTQATEDQGFDPAPEPDPSATQPAPEPIVEQPVSDAIVEERKESTQTFEQEPESNEAPAVTAAQKRRGKAKGDGLSDSQHESSDQPE